MDRIPETVQNIWSHINLEPQHKISVGEFKSKFPIFLQNNGVLARIFVVSYKEFFRYVTDEAEPGLAWIVAIYTPNKPHSYPPLPPPPPLPLKYYSLSSSIGYTLLAFEIVDYISKFPDRQILESELIDFIENSSHCYGYVDLRQVFGALLQEGLNYYLKRIPNASVSGGDWIKLCFKKKSKKVSK